MQKPNFENLIEKEKDQVFLFYSRVSIPFCMFNHPWFVINKKGDISRWEVIHIKNASKTSWGYLSKNLLPPFSGMKFFLFIFVNFRWNAKLLAQIEGEEARATIKFIEESPTNYRSTQYYAFTGPNSNTYAQWVLDKCPFFRTKLPPGSIGRDYTLHL